MNNKQLAAKLCMEAMEKLEEIHEIVAVSDADSGRDAAMLTAAVVVLESVNVGLKSIIKKAEKERVRYELS